MGYSRSAFPGGKSALFEENPMKNDDFRRSGHQFVDWIADYFEKIEKDPVRSRVAPGDIK